MHAFYSAQGRMTSPGRHKSLFDGLPSGAGALAAVAQGQIVHEFLTKLYGFELSDERRATVHVRPVEEILDHIAAVDSRPLPAAREPHARFVGDCRHFTVFTVAMLRAQGTPARARCGFGGYFGTGMFEDHWVCEYWHAGQQRWVLVDAQVDGQQRRWFEIDFDVTDVPRDRFLIAGQAWAQCRFGVADPAGFGLSMVKEGGDWWIAGNLMRDAAALRNIELLPWDCWGAMPTPDHPIGGELTALFDRLAALTQTPDASFAELRQLCEDNRLRVPPAVHNHLRDRDETLTLLPCGHGNPA